MANFDYLKTKHQKSILKIGYKAGRTKYQPFETYFLKIKKSLLRQHHRSILIVDTGLQ
jgi:hypothetical protein